MGTTYSAPARPALKPTQPSIQWVTGHSWGQKRPERVFDHSPHLALRLKKEESCASTETLGLCGMFLNELYPYIFLYLKNFILHYYLGLSYETFFYCGLCL